MLTVRRAADRGHTDLGWLDSYHTFSFGEYRDPGQPGFRALRVLNDDRIAPGKGFGAHGHRDMEILTYVLTGMLAHKDSMSDEQSVVANEVQAMSAGSGVIHSEFNPSLTEPVHLLQIWIEPSVADVAPSYQRTSSAPDDRRGRLQLLARPMQDADPSAVHLHQDARMYAALLDAGDSIEHAIASGRHAWVQCASGEIEVNGLALRQGDGLAVSDEARLTLRGTGSASNELLLFDLA